MDADRFDRFARAVSGASSRRAALRLLAGGALGGLLGAGGQGGAAAACRLAQQRCSDAHRCCPGSRCIRGKCKCKEASGFFACDGPGTRCIDVDKSARHCGGCGNPPCGENEICLNGGCVDPCEDGLQDGLETDVDCGGPDCPRCAKGKGCEEDDDCEGELICDRDATCQDPHSCFDGVQNGRETDVDCGGPDCAGCPDGRTCFIDDDCENRFCDRSDDATEAGVCGTRPSCRNGRKDGTETDVDCGGPDCPGCEFGHTCDSADDCRGLAFCLDRAGDGTAKKVCVGCKIDDHCLAVHGEARPFCARNKCRQCRDEVDCAAGEECDDGTCKAAGTCAADQNVCLDGITGCNGADDCYCYQTTSQESFCGGGWSSCFACQADGDCEVVEGPGSACIDMGGSNCGGCLSTNRRACTVPCPTGA